ncbi:MAG: hypothetical protein D6717_00985 [Gammaproteobacteria bacterium]|nr:MAG: hypothetical protein D6717_00985 [Gammaproteobacteria bacterium]
MTPAFLLRGSRYWLLAGAILLGLYLPLLYRDWLSLKKEAIHDIEWYTSSLAQLLSRDLAQYLGLEQVLSHLDRPFIRRQFDEHVHQKIGHLGLLRIKIYRRDGHQLYNSDGGPLQPEQPDADFRQVLTGAAVTYILDQDTYQHKYGNNAGRVTAETYYPILAGNPPAPAFVLEAYYDATSIIDRIHHLFLPRAISLALILLGVGGACAFILRKNLLLSDRVEQLEAFLPICSHCKKIRVEQDERTEWVAIDRYFSEENHISFSHGICDDCLAEHYPEVARKKKEVRSG